MLTFLAINHLQGQAFYVRIKVDQGAQFWFPGLLMQVEANTKERRLQKRVQDDRKHPK